VSLTAPTANVGRIKSANDTNAYYLVVLFTFSAVVLPMVVLSVFVVISLFGYKVSTAEPWSLNLVNSVFPLAEFTQLFQFVLSEPGGSVSTATKVHGPPYPGPQNQCPP
jgi:hypothetical protein